MNKLITVTGLAAILAACASAPERNDQLEQARAEVQAFTADPLAQQAASNDVDQARSSLNQADVEWFISQVPTVHQGDQSMLLFTSKGAVVTFNGRTMGDINDPHFTYVMLRTFLGPAPSSPQLKRALLGQE